MDVLPRRAVMKGGLLAALAFTIGDRVVYLSPGEAHAQGVALRTLKAEEAETLGSLCEALVPDARKAGIVEYIDQQISGPPSEALLQARILNVRPPFANFYRAAVGAVDKGVAARHAGKRFAQLSSDEARSFIKDMQANKIEGWQGPGTGFVYTVLRTDAVDVVYNTVAGYEALGVPYQAHILPPKKW